MCAPLHLHLNLASKAMRTHKLLMSCPLTQKGRCSLHRSVNITVCCEYYSNMPVLAVENICTLGFCFFLLVPIFISSSTFFKGLFFISISPFLLYILLFFAKPHLSLCIRQEQKKNKIITIIIIITFGFRISVNTISYL